MTIDYKDHVSEALSKFKQYRGLIDIDIRPPVDHKEVVVLLEILMEEAKTLHRMFDEAFEKLGEK